MTDKFKQFKVYAPPSQKEYNLNDDGTLTITGVFSTTNKDLDGDIVSPKALESLKNQAVGLNLHLDHNHNYDGGIGAITDSFIKENQVYITAKILKEHAQGILERLMLGMNFGFSVGGIPVVNNLNPQIIDDFVLLEISLTLLPANWDTFGTVEAKGVVKSKCLTGACHYIIKNSKNIMKKEIEDIDSNKLQEMIVNYVNEAFANKEPVIIDEFRNELQPIVAEIVAEQVTPKVQEIVVNYLDELFPPVEEEIVEASVDEEEVEPAEVPEEEEEAEKSEDEEVIEEKETDEEVVEEKSEDEEVIEEKETDDEVVEEEVVPVEEEKAVDEEEVPEEVFDEPLEIEIEKEEEVPEPVLDEAAIEAIVERVLEEKSKQIANAKKAVRTKKSAKSKKTVKTTTKPSKLNSYRKSTKKPVKKNSFLNSDTRDRFGRNKKYL